MVPFPFEGLSTTQQAPSHKCDPPPVHLHLSVNWLNICPGSLSTLKGKTFKESPRTREQDFHTLNATLTISLSLSRSLSLSLSLSVYVCVSVCVCVCERERAHTC